MLRVCVILEVLLFLKACLFLKESHLRCALGGALVSYMRGTPLGLSYSSVFCAALKFEHYWFVERSRAR